MNQVKRNQIKKKQRKKESKKDRIKKGNKIRTKELKAIIDVRLGRNLPMPSSLEELDEMFKRTK